MIITCLQKIKINNTLIISDLKNSNKIVFVPDNFCEIRCEIAILKLFFSFKCQIQNL